MDATLTYEQLFDILRREKSRDELQRLDKSFYDSVRIFIATKEDMIRAETSRGANLAVQRATIEFQNVRKILRELYDRRERKIVTMALHRTRTDAALVDNESLLPEEQLFLESLVHLMVQSREQVLSAVEMRAAMVVTPSRQYVIHPEDDERQHESQHRSYSSTQPIAQPHDDADDNDAGRASSNFATHSHDAEEAAGDTFTTTEPQLTVHFLAPVPKFVGKDLRVFGPFEEGQSADLPDDIARILIKKGRAQESGP